ncbi:Major facilitator super domain-containing protein 8 [Homalodisca vitripennis]|nr:Major facilitator super domain-containing protein 8 [Homalodisca vitripennis]
MDQQNCIWTPKLCLGNRSLCLPRNKEISYRFEILNTTSAKCVTGDSYLVLTECGVQGVWMGLMTGSGCLSRVLGPVFVSYVYTRLGPVWTFGFTTAMMLVAMIWLQFVVKRLSAAILQGTGATCQADSNQSDKCTDDNEIPLNLVSR